MSTDDKAPLPEAVREQIEREVETVVGHDLTCESYTAGCMCDFELRALDMATALEKIARAAWEAAAQQERARLAAIFNQTETDVWRAHEVRDFLLSQNMAHPQPTPEGR